MVLLVVAAMNDPGSCGCPACMRRARIGEGDPYGEGDRD